MKIEVLCEESGTVTGEFIKLGHVATSYDLLPTSGEYPDSHVQGDAMVDIGKRNVDLRISFPPCTDLAVSGARWFPEKRANGSQEASIKFFLEVWKHSNCVENPIGIMSAGKYIKKHFPELWAYANSIGFPWKPSQIIQPWQFGHGETKATCLWLKRLPLIQPTDIVEGREQRVWKLPPSAERGKLRSKTYQGIAAAMASQWTEILPSQ